jgi:hypothetical protein
MSNPNPKKSTCRFSTRISIRWLPEPAQETTDTIVMSVKDWYLDLRIEKQTGKIDWAIAGQRIIENQEPCMLFAVHSIQFHEQPPNQN